MKKITDELINLTLKTFNEILVNGSEMDEINGKEYIAFESLETIDSFIRIYAMCENTRINRLDAIHILSIQEFALRYLTKFVDE